MIPKESEVFWMILKDSEGFWMILMDDMWGHQRDLYIF